MTCTKRRRPSKHYRTIRKRNGSMKRILINPGVTRKRKKQTIPTITRKQRKVFNHLSNPDEFNSEWGGAIDFDKKGNVENIGVIPGSTYEVDIPDDYEVKYHTHPDRNPSPPSPEDIVALMGDDRQQAELVFRNGITYSVLKTPKTKSLKRLGHKKLLVRIRKIFNEANDEEEYLNELKKMGFKVSVSKDKTSPIKIAINPVE